MSDTFLPYGRQSIDESDIQAVVETLRSEYLTTGPKVPEFERALKQHIGARHAVAVDNGTSALHAACAAAGIGPGDEVIVPAITFVASANCVRYVGGEPVFADVDPDSGLISPASVEALLSERTRAIIPVHLNGCPVDLEAIAAIARARDLIVIEDAAHALGASFKGHPIGDSFYSNMTTYSFHPVKHITTGEGGAVATHDDALADKLRCVRDHGLTRTEEGFINPSPGPWYYEQQVLGHNMRLSAIHCALGTSQLARLEGFLARRRAIAARYGELLASVEHVKPVADGPEGASSAYHLYPVLIDFKGCGKSRAEVMARLRDLRVGTQVHYIPVPSQPYYVERGHSMEGLPGAAAYSARVLSLPMYADLIDEDVDRVVKALDKVLHG